MQGRPCRPHWLTASRAALPPTCPSPRLPSPLLPPLLPPQVPLLVGTTVLKGLQGWRQKRKLRREATAGNLLREGGVREVALEWEGLECTLADKEGKTRALLQGMAGAARPGRCACLQEGRGRGLGWLGAVVCGVGARGGLGLAGA